MRPLGFEVGNLVLRWIHSKKDMRKLSPYPHLGKAHTLLPKYYARGLTSYKHKTDEATAVARTVATAVARELCNSNATSCSRFAPVSNHFFFSSEHVFTDRGDTWHAKRVK
jgi:hypothetical protein